jgi:hypothetical protein
MKSKNLVGRKAKIVSDNENYTPYLNKVLTITYASNEGNGYDNSCYPEMLCDFKMSNGESVPFALYEYEFELI